MGQGVFTCKFLIFESRLYSAIWIRLFLPGFQFSKSQRKLFRKLEKQFTWEFAPLSINREKEALYQRYERQFSGRIAPSLASSLHDDGIHNIFNSWEVCIREQDSGKLVAYSVFDLGHDSLTSIVGIYDPDYAPYSLGYFSMLLEVFYGMENGYTFYYPGYVAPGYPKFDYKLRLGPVAYYADETGEWIDADPMAIQTLPHKAMEQALLQVQSLLKARYLNSTLRIYPPYEANILGYWVLDYLEYPTFLDVSAPHRLNMNELITVVFNHTSKEYIVLACERYEDLSGFFEEPVRRTRIQSWVELDLLVKNQIIGICQSPEEVVDIVLPLLSADR